MSKIPSKGGCWTKTPTSWKRLPHMRNYGSLSSRWDIRNLLGLAIISALHTPLYVHLSLFLHQERELMPNDSHPGERTESIKPGQWLFHSLVFSLVFFSTSRFDLQKSYFENLSINRNLILNIQISSYNFAYDMIFIKSKSLIILFSLWVMTNVSYNYIMMNYFL